MTAISSLAASMALNARLDASQEIIGNIAGTFGPATLDLLSGNPPANQARPDSIVPDVIPDQARTGGGIQSLAALVPPANLAALMAGPFSLEARASPAAVPPGVVSSGQPQANASAVLHSVLAAVSGAALPANTAQAADTAQAASTAAPAPLSALAASGQTPASASASVSAVVPGSPAAQIIPTAFATSIRNDGTASGVPVLPPGAAGIAQAAAAGSPGLASSSPPSDARQAAMLQGQAMAALPGEAASGVAPAPAATPMIVALVAQLGNPALLDWSAQAIPAIIGSPALATTAGQSREVTGSASLVLAGESPLRLQPVATGIANPLDDGRGKTASSAPQPAGQDRTGPASPLPAQGGGAETASLREPALAAGLAPPPLFGGDPGLAMRGGAASAGILNAAMIPGWPAQRPYANAPGKEAQAARQPTPNPAMTDEEIIAYLVNFGADEKMQARAKRMLEMPVVGKKLMTFLAVMMTAMTTVLRSVKDELEAMLAEDEEEGQNGDGHSGLARHGQPGRSSLYIKSRS